MNRQRTQNELFERTGIPLFFTGTGTLPAWIRGPKEPFPRVMLHDGVAGSGYPLLYRDAQLREVLDVRVAEQIARFGFWCVQPGYLWDGVTRSGQHYALDYVRGRHPGIRIFAHLLTSALWPVASTDRLSYQARYQDIVGADVWRETNGTATTWPNLTVRRVRDELVELWIEVIARGGFDGAFLDPIASGCGWMLAGRSIDLSGYASIDAWSDALVAAHGEIVHRLREEFPDRTFFGNGGPAGTYPDAKLLNGWWRENFPHQNPVGWFPNFTGPLGMLADRARYSSPRFCVLSIATDWADQQRMRYGLASSCLADYALVVGPGNFATARRYFEWWLPQYGVDRSSGLAVDQASGWLGRAAGDAYEVAGTLSSEVRVVARDFVYGGVVVNPHLVPKRFVLERDWIMPQLGSQNAMPTNGGVYVPAGTELTLAAEDALFLGRP